MVLHFGKMHCLGEDLMVVELLGQQARLDAQQVQIWSSRSRGVGFKRLVLLEIPGSPDVDFNCRVLDREGQELEARFVDIICAAAVARERRLTLARSLKLQARSHCWSVQLRDDGWAGAGHAGLCQASAVSLQTLPAPLFADLQALCQRHELNLQGLCVEQQLLCWSSQDVQPRLQRFLQPVARRLRGMQVLWLNPSKGGSRLQLWQDGEMAGLDPAQLAVYGLLHFQPQFPARIDWHQGSLLVEQKVGGDFWLFAHPQRVYEGQIKP